MNYSDLLPYCKNEEQQKKIEACIEHGSQAKAAKALGIGTRQVERAIAKIKLYAKTPSEIIGKSDEAVKAPFVIKGTSTLYDMQTGEAKIAWIKTNAQHEEQLDHILESFKSTLADYKPLPKIRQIGKTNKDLLAIYPMGDPHLGMYSWAQETGSDFDCDIAERNLIAAFDYLIERTPPAETAIILNLGDFFHSDSSGNTTTKGTAVDVDSRHGRVFRIGVAVMVEAINRALTKHKRVIVRNNRGNHDKDTSVALSVCLEYAFKDNKRVEFANPFSPYFFHEFGNNLIFSTHGDGLKPKQAQGFVSSAYSKEWGACEHRHAYFGHFHHEQRFEENGLLVEIFNTLAAQDAWHHTSGYKSKRNMKSIVLDRNQGEIERFTYNLSRDLMLK